MCIAGDKRGELRAASAARPRLHTRAQWLRGGGTNTSPGSILSLALTLALGLGLALTLALALALALSSIPTPTHARSPVSPVTLP